MVSMVGRLRVFKRKQHGFNFVLLKPLTWKKKSANIVREKEKSRFNSFESIQNRGKKNVPLENNFITE